MYLTDVRTKLITRKDKVKIIITIIVDRRDVTNKYNNIQNTMKNEFSFIEKKKNLHNR